MRGFLFEAIKIAHFLKFQDRENRLHEQVIQTWVDEAEIKGKSSKLVKFSLLKSALDYSVKIGNKEKIESLKKELSKLDFSDELKEIALPKEEREKFERLAKIYFEKLEKGIEEYVKKLMEMPPLAVILNLCNDSSLIRTNVQETRKFVEKLINEHPVQNIFLIMLDTGNKIINMNSPEEKKEYQLHTQLLLGVRETLWMVNMVFEKIENTKIIDSSNIVDFLSRSIGLSENNLNIVSSGVVHHFQKDYVASISILTPLIEGVLFDYLHSIGADTSSYEGTTIEQRELGGLLNQKELKDNFGEDFQYFLKLFLTEPDAINFRNRFAHGLASAVEFNHIVSSNILFIILKICSKTFKS